jgi:hypothetical protein
MRRTKTSDEAKPTVPSIMKVAYEARSMYPKKKLVCKKPNIPVRPK